MDFETSAEFLQDKILQNTKIAMVIGSGLSSIVDTITDKRIASYSSIPGFLKSTAPTHKGEFITGKLFGKPIICMNGRFHYYEGYGISEVAGYIKTLKLLGIEKIILTNAAGSMREDLRPGDLIVVKDHINLSGLNPLRGDNDIAFGPRFVDMSNAYTKELIDKVMAQSADVLTTGTYVFTTGPSFETAAEIKAFHLLGGDIVGMSTVPEVIMSAYCGIQTLTISCISNYATGIPGSNVTDKELVRVTAMAQDKFIGVIQKLFDNL